MIHVLRAIKALGLDAVDGPDVDTLLRRTGKLENKRDESRRLQAAA